LRFETGRGGSVPSGWIIPEIVETIRFRACHSSMKMVCVPVMCLGLIAINDCESNAIHGSGVLKTETRIVSSFSRIDLAGSPDVEITSGSPASVTVSADDNIVTNIETKVSGETLRIDSKHSYNSSLGVKVNITVPNLKGVAISGSGNIHVTGLKAGDLDAAITGSGNIVLTGSAEGLNVQITGSGNLQAGDLTAKHVAATVTGSGDATVDATEELEASIIGSGSVRYSGNPPHIRKNVTGSGDIDPL
jgi:hypothetical protein